MLQATNVVQPDGTGVYSDFWPAGELKRRKGITEGVAIRKFVPAAGARPDSIPPTAGRGIAPQPHSFALSITRAAGSMQGLARD